MDDVSKELFELITDRVARIVFCDNDCEEPTLLETRMVGHAMMRFDIDKAIIQAFANRPGELIS